MTPDMQKAFNEHDTFRMLQLMQGVQLAGAAAAFVLPSPNVALDGSDELTAYDFANYDLKAIHEQYILAFDFEGKPFAQSQTAGELARTVAKLDIPLILVYNDLHAELAQSPFCSLVVSYGALPAQR